MTTRRIIQSASTGSTTSLEDQMPRLTTAERLALTPDLGEQVYDTEQQRILTFNKNVWGVSTSINDGQSVTQPAGGWNSDNTRVSQTTLEGGVYLAKTDLIINRLLINVTAHGGVGTLRVLLYQDQDVDGVTELIGSITNFDPAGTGAREIAFDGGGDIHIQQGVLFIAWGEDSASGSVTLTTYTFTTTNLLSTNVPAPYIPNNFTSAILANTSPASINFEVGGGDITEGGGTDNVIIVRSRKV